MCKRLSLALVLFAFPGAGHAAPAVNGVSGTLESGQSVLVSGTGFGAKSPAAPILWETFDDGIHDTPLATDPDWPSYSDGGALYSSISPHSGGLCVFNRVAYAAPTGNGFATNNYFFDEANEIYYSYLYRHQGTSVGPGVPKHGRINTPSHKYSSPGVVALSDSYVYYRPDESYVYPADDYGTGRYFSDPLLGSANWTRHQIFGRLSEPAGTANGLILVSVGDEEKTFADIVTRSAGQTVQFNSIILGLMFANVSEVPGAEHDMYVDDVYIDNSRARVELCAGSTWTSRGECHPQPPTSWADGSIAANLNTAQWGDGATVYLYVVDAQGETNANGHELSLGASGTTPSPPANLQLIP